MDAIELLLNAKNQVTSRSAMMTLYNAVDYLQRGHYDWCETYEPGLCEIIFSDEKVCNSTGLSKWLGCLAHEAAIVAAIPDLRDLDRAHQMKNAEVSA